MSAEASPFGLLNLALAKAVSAAQSALDHFNITHQLWMVVEECAELLLALARFQRGRGGADAIVTEAADVIVMGLQMGLLYSADANTFAAELATKVERLLRRIEGASA